MFAYAYNRKASSEKTFSAFLIEGRECLNVKMEAE